MLLIWLILPKFRKIDHSLLTIINKVHSLLIWINLFLTYQLNFKQDAQKMIILISFPTQKSNISMLLSETKVSQHTPPTAGDKT